MNDVEENVMTLKKITHTTVKKSYKLDKNDVMVMISYSVCN